MYEKKNPNKIWYVVIGVVVGTILLLALLALLVKSMYKDEGEGSSEQSTVVSTETSTTAKPESKSEKATEAAQPAYSFRSKKLKDQHYEKHGREMGFADADAYEAAAAEVVNDSSSLHKIEKEDGDDVYYREADNAFVVVSTDGYIRTFFYPNGGKKYYDKQ